MISDLRVAYGKKVIPFTLTLGEGKSLNKKTKAFHILFWMATNIYLTISNVDLVRKNDDERVQCSFGENTVQFFLYIDGILDEDCVINKDGVIE